VAQLIENLAHRIERLLARRGCGFTGGLTGKRENF